MKIIYTILLLTTLIFLDVQFCFSQSYTTTSKNCGKCGRSVSANSKIGAKCPYCGVVWGSENTHTSTSSQKYLNQIPTKSNSKKQPVRNEEDVDNSTASKSQTENWILVKLRTNTPKRYYDNYTSKNNMIPLEERRPTGWYNMNYYYTFDNNNLIVEYEKEEENGGKMTKYKIKIPIYDIDMVFESKGDFFISTKKSTITYYNLTDNRKFVSGSFFTNLNTYSETDLCKRLSKAFIHLKKFYRKPPATEPF